MLMKRIIAGFTVTAMTLSMISSPIEELVNDIADNVIVASADRAEGFIYYNADTFAADALLGMAILPGGEKYPGTDNAFGYAPSSRNFICDQIAVEVAQNTFEYGSAMYWQNLEKFLKGDFNGIFGYQEIMYEGLIMDYLAYQGKSSEFKSDILKSSVDFSKDILKEVFDSEVESLDLLSKEDAQKIAKDIKVIKKLDKANDVLGDVYKAVKTGKDYYEKLGKALAVKQANDNRIAFLKEMKNAASNDEYFRKAVDKVIGYYEESVADTSFSYLDEFATEFTIEFAWKTFVSDLSKMCPAVKESSLILELGTTGLDWLFNNDDISSSMMQTVAVYIMGTYAKEAYQNIRDDYNNSVTLKRLDNYYTGSGDQSIADEKLKAAYFLNAYENVIAFKCYANTIVDKYLYEKLCEGLWNKFISIFSDDNSTAYKDWSSSISADKATADKWLRIVNEYRDFYYRLSGYTYPFDDSDSYKINADIENQNKENQQSLEELLAELEPVTYRITEPLTLTSNMVIRSDVVVSANINLDGNTLTIMGDLIHESGQMMPNSGTLNIDGSYRIQKALSNGNYSESEGYLFMCNDYDSVNIKGDFITQSTYCNVSNMLCAGVMTIGGNLYQYGDDNFISSDKHQVVFTGERTHELYFDTTCFNKIDNLIVNDHGRIKYTNLFPGLKLYQDMIIDSDTVLKGNSYYYAPLDLNGYKLTIKGDLENISNVIEVNKGVLDVEGDLIANNTILAENGIITVNNDLIERDSINIDKGIINIMGDLIHESGQMMPNSGTLNIDGSYRIQKALSNGNYSESEGYLFMCNDYDNVNIKGDFITQSTYCNVSNMLCAGTITIGGDFYQYGDANFISSEIHKVILNGTEKQNVYFNSRDSHFNILELTEPKVNYTFSYEPCWNTLICPDDTHLVTGKIEVNGGNGAGELTVELKDSDGKKLDAEIGEDGSFNVKNLSEGSYTVTVKKKGYVSKNVEVEIKAGQPVELDIELYQYGDVDGDGRLNMIDYAKLQQKLNGWDIDTLSETADLNGDGRVNMMDYALLQQYLNGWDIEFKE